MFKIQRKQLSTPLAPDFLFQFSSDIWELKAFQGKLLITLRSKEELKTSFSLFEQRERRFLWQDLSFSEEWWLSVFYAYGSVIVFQVFEDTQDISSRSFFGFDWHNQQTTWSLEDCKILATEGVHLKVEGTSPDAPALLFNIESGEWVEEKIVNTVDDIALYPVHYEEDSSYFDTLATFLSTYAKVTIKGSCDYLEYGDYIFIAAHVVQNKAIDLQFFAFDSAGTLLLQESLDKELKGLAAGTFLIAEEELIFVKGKRELQLYPLEK